MADPPGRLKSLAFEPSGSIAEPSKVGAASTAAPGKGMPSTAQPLTIMQSTSMVNTTTAEQPESVELQSEPTPEIVELKAKLHDARQRVAELEEQVRIAVECGYISDIAEADDSEEADELDADSQSYAPFGMPDVEDDAEDEPIPEGDDIGALDGEVTIASDRFAELGSAIEKDGFDLLINEALTAEHESGSMIAAVYHDRGQDFWKAMSLTTLCSMPERAVKELTGGNLKQAYDSDSDLRETLDAFQERGRQHPCIYARTLTTASGELMTVAETMRLAKWLQRYVSESPEIVGHPRCIEAFKRIDQQFHSEWKRVNPQAEPAYLASTAQERIQSRVDNVALFFKQLLARCDASEEKDIVLKPLIYIGYAGRADRRKRQHEACGQSSNWLATLVQAICNVLWGQGRFQMHFMVICMLSSDLQCQVAEMLLTRISGAYYNVGSGFCIDVAGKSIESARFKSLTHDEKTDKWNELAEWVSINTPMEKAMADSEQKAEVKLKAQLDTVKANLQKKLLTIRANVASLYVIRQEYLDRPLLYPDDEEVKSEAFQSHVAMINRDWDSLTVEVEKCETMLKKLKEKAEQRGSGGSGSGS